MRKNFTGSVRLFAVKTNGELVVVARRLVASAVHETKSGELSMLNVRLICDSQFSVTLWLLRVMDSSRNGVLNGLLKIISTGR